MINVFSEIGPLKEVMLHEPGEEIENLTPSYLGELLFDDIPWLEKAKEEHKAFAKVFLDEGIKVSYLEDLVVEALYNDKIKNEFIDEFILEARINSETLEHFLSIYLRKIKDTKELVKTCIKGVKMTDLPGYKKRTLADYVSEKLFVCDPIPNLYFTRDPFASIGNFVAINRMYSKTRKRETIFAKYIFKYHPRFKDTKLVYTRDERCNLEGGDILVLNKETLIVGVSQRTSPEGLSKLAKNILFAKDSSFIRVLALTIPDKRTFMHLDTVFTQVDYDKFMIHQGCIDRMETYLLERKENTKSKLKVKKLNKRIDEVLEQYIGKKVTLIPCGGLDAISSDREQWSDGSNCICIRPGVVICYERNEISNKVLEENGIKVIRIPSSELSRGRGGPRCMSMPLNRENLR